MRGFRTGALEGANLHDSSALGYSFVVSTINTRILHGVSTRNQIVSGRMSTLEATVTHDVLVLCIFAAEFARTIFSENFSGLLLSTAIVTALHC
jgi:hypothetical protein